MTYRFLGKEEFSMSRIRLIVAVCALALVAVPTVASAKPAPRGFARTFPHASKLCAKVANGHTPKALQASAAQVSAACAELRTSYTNAVNAYNTAAAPLRQQATDSIQARRAACQADPKSDACKQARAATRTKLKELGTQLRAAKKTYHEAVQAARKAFWAKIKTLRGGSTVKPDPTVGAGPATTLPTT
jgi:hypothetical protein